MIICCITECSSRNSDKNGRSFFKIHDGRSDWLEIIKKQQPIVKNRQLHICDLHFNVDDIRKGKKSSILRVGAIPNLNSGTEIQNENGNVNKSSTTSTRGQGNGCSTNSSTNDHNPLMTELLLPCTTSVSNKSTTSDSIHREAETQVKGLTSKQQSDLISQVSKLRRAVQHLENEIKMKDNQIEELKKPRTFNNLTNEQNEVINCLINGIPSGVLYPESIRQFCLKQQFYSTAAYEALRLFFNKNLPSIRTIKLWYSSVDGSPGINSSALDALREEADSYRMKNHHPLHVTLISDEMAIRKQISWNVGEEAFTGFSTVESSSKHRESEDARPKSTAKDALVFLIVGPNFKIPVAFHFLDGLDAVDRAALTLEVIKCVEELSIIIVSLSADGLHANILVAKLLGARFDEEKPYFSSPTYPDQKIYIIFDPPHMLKLVRKQFSKIRIYSQKGLVDWNLLRILVEKQRLENFNLCNKLTEHHINWQERPMSVKIACETISNSVADVLEQLQNDEYDEFKDAEATVEFLRCYNDLFDILNFSCHSRPDNKYKQAIRNETVCTIFPFLDSMEAYIKDLQIEFSAKNGVVRKPILKSRAHMGLYGFQTDIMSLKGIFNDFVKNGPLKVFYTMQFSQDHLETLFSLIRNSLGRNDNPSVTEFTSAFKKLLVCHPLVTSMNHNVISNATGILTKPAVYKVTRKPMQVLEPEVIEINFKEAIKHEIEGMGPFEMHACAYVASRIEDEIRKIAKIRTKSSCFECINILSQDDKVRDELLAMKYQGSIQPCKSTVDIVIFSNFTINMITSDQKYHLDAVQKTICRNLDIGQLYIKSDFEHSGEYHKEEFVAQVVKTYLSLKSQNIGKRITNEERGAFIRNRLKTQIHLNGQ